MRYHLLTLIILGCSTLTAGRRTNSKPRLPMDQPPARASRSTCRTRSTKCWTQINSVNAYQKPKLSLKLNDRYAHTSEDVVPFGGVEPFKSHFLLQMEYTGAGRAIPEPEDLKTVKIGFVGPIMSTVSVATGGKSHEEDLGIKMLQGAQLAIEQANAAGGYHAAPDPL